MKRPRAFTLVELLVVISIIALLIAILLPSLRKAREVSYAVRCQANLRTVFQACYFYAGDNKNVAPPLLAADPDGSIVLSNFRNWWFHHLIPDSKPRVGSYLPPWNQAGALLLDQPVAINRSMGYWALGYGMVNIGYGNYVRLIDVEQSAREVYLGDSREPSDPEAGPWQRGAILSRSYVSIHPRHPDDHLNILFVDGHVELVGLEILDDPQRWDFK